MSEIPAGHISGRSIKFEEFFMDTVEAIDIEEWLEKETMKKLDLCEDYRFRQEMERMPDMPIQLWEYEVSSYLRVWV